MIRTLQRLARAGLLPELGFEKPSGMDRHGAPTWASPVLAPARVARVTKEVLNAQGDRVLTDLELWLPVPDYPGTEMPAKGWRVQHQGGSFLIMTDREVLSINGTPTHYRYSCRRT